MLRKQIWVILRKSGFSNSEKLASCKISSCRLVKYGSLKVRFWINEEGQIVDIRLLRNDADPVVVDFSISGILRADIPPVPKELIEKTQDGKMEFEYEIIIY